MDVRTRERLLCNKIKQMLKGERLWRCSDGNGSDPVLEASGKYSGEFSALQIQFTASHATEHNATCSGELCRYLIIIAIIIILSPIVYMLPLPKNIVSASSTTDIDTTA